MSVDFSASGGLLLPPPSVQLVSPRVPSPYFVADGSSINGFLQPVASVNEVRVSTVGIAASVLDNPALGLQLELLRYAPRTRRQHAYGGNGRKSAGYVHPSNAAAPYSGSFTHGGMHSAAGAGIEALRQTEWPVLPGNSTINITQGVLAFMCMASVQYRTAAALGYMPCVVPSCNLSKRSGTFKRYAYDRLFSGAYFATRYSVKDLADPREKRIWGPSSLIFNCGPEVMPFRPDGVNGLGFAQCTIAPGYGAKTLLFRLDSRRP